MVRIGQRGGVLPLGRQEPDGGILVLHFITANRPFFAVESLPEQALNLRTALQLSDILRDVIAWHFLVVRRPVMRVEGSEKLVDFPNEGRERLAVELEVFGHQATVEEVQASFSHSTFSSPSFRGHVHVVKNSSHVDHVASVVPHEMEAFKEEDKPE